MNIVEILAKVTKGEELTEAEKKLLASFDPDKEKNDAAAAARRKAEEEAAKSKAEVERLKKELADATDAQAQADAAKLSDAEKAAKELSDLKKKIDSLEKAKVEADSKAAAMLRSQTIRDAAKGAGIALAPKTVSEKLFYDMLEATLADVDINDKDALSAALGQFKTENPGVIVAPGSGSGVNGGNPTNTPSSKNPWAKDTFNVTEQVKMYSESPDQARALAAAAGVKLT